MIVFQRVMIFGTLQYFVSLNFNENQCQVLKKLTREWYNNESFYAAIKALKKDDILYCVITK